MAIVSSRFQPEHGFGRVTPDSERRCIELEDSDDDDVTSPNGSVPTLTDDAVRNFESAITAQELDRLLGPKMGGVEVSAEARSGQQQVRAQEEQTVRRVQSMPARRRRTKETSSTRTEDAQLEGIINDILKTTPQNSVKVDDRTPRSKQETSKVAVMGEEGAVGGATAKTDNVSDSNVRQHLEEIRELRDAQEHYTNLHEREKVEMERLLNTVKNMGLVVGSKNDKGASKKSQSAFARVAEHVGVQTTQKQQQQQQTTQRPQQPDSHSSKPPVAPKRQAPEKSPRFVRRRDTLPSQPRGRVVPAASLLSSNFDSMSSLASADLPDMIDTDSLVPDDREEITSRLGGRRSCQAGSRSASVMSCDDDLGDVIQWKRGNMLGKGAYGIVYCGLTNLGALIAVKQIELNVTDMNRAEAEYEKITEEVDLLKTLCHENIVG